MSAGHWLFMSKSMVTVFIPTFFCPPLAFPTSVMVLLSTDSFRKLQIVF